MKVASRYGSADRFSLDLRLNAGGAAHILASETDLGTGEDEGDDTRDDNPGKDDQPVNPHRLAVTSKVDCSQTTDTISEGENLANTEEARHDDPVQNTTRGGEHQDHEHGSRALETIDGQEVRKQEEDRDERNASEPDEGKGNTAVEVLRHLVAVEDLRHHPEEDGVDD